MSRKRVEVSTIDYVVLLTLLGLFSWNLVLLVGHRPYQQHDPIEQLRPGMAVESRFLCNMPTRL